MIMISLAGARAAVRLHERERDGRGKGKDIAPLPFPAMLHPPCVRLAHKGVTSNAVFRFSPASKAKRGIKAPREKSTSIRGGGRRRLGRL